MEAQLTGEKGAFNCPVRLFFFGPSDPTSRSRIEAALEADRLVKAAQLKKTRKEAEARRLATGLKAGSATKDAGLASKREPTLEDLMKVSEAAEFRLGGDAIKTLAVGEEYLSKMPMADQPSELAATLLPYQLQVGSPFPSSVETLHAR